MNAPDSVRLPRGSQPLHREQSPERNAEEALVQKGAEVGWKCRSQPGLATRGLGRLADERGRIVVWQFDPRMSGLTGSSRSSKSSPKTISLCRSWFRTWRLSGFDQVARQFRETDARIDKIAHEGAERSRALDERVDRTGERYRRDGPASRRAPPSIREISRLSRTASISPTPRDLSAVRVDHTPSDR